jgi:hypothetical protein
MSVDLSTYIDLLPDVYDKQVAPTKSNIRKLFEVLEEVLQVLIDTAEQNRQIKDINNAEGKVLDAIGEDFGIGRYGKTDDEYIALILARIYERIAGNTVDKIENFFRFFTNLSINVVPLTDDSIRLTYLNGIYIWRAFSVEAPGLTLADRARFTPALQFLKAAGIYGTINFTQHFNPATDFPGSDFEDAPTAVGSWQSVSVDGDKSLIAESSTAPGQDVHPLRLPAVGDWTNVAGAGNLTPFEFRWVRRVGTKVIWNGGNQLFTHDGTTHAFINQDPAATVSTSMFLHYETGLIIGIGRYAAGASSRFFYSTTEGVSWTSVGTPFSDYPNFYSFVQCVKFGSTVVVAFRSTLNRFFVSRSTNNGGTWTGITLERPSTDDCFSMDRNTSGATIIMATRTRLITSIDSGASWTLVTYASLSLPIPVTNSVRIYFMGGTNWGLVILSGGVLNLYKSINDGASWTLVAPLPLDQIDLALYNDALWFRDTVTDPTKFRIYRYAITDSVPQLFYETSIAASTLINDVFETATDYWFSGYSGMGPKVPVLQVSKVSSKYPEMTSRYYRSSTQHCKLATFIGGVIQGIEDTNISVTTGFFGRIMKSNTSFSERTAYAIYDRTKDTTVTKQLVPNNWSRIVRFNGKLVIAGADYSGYTLYSEDNGVTWKQCKGLGPHIANLVEFNGALFALSGVFTAGTFNYAGINLFKSLDGINFVASGGLGGGKIGTTAINRFRVATDATYIYNNDGSRNDGAGGGAALPNMPIDCFGISVYQGDLYVIKIVAPGNFGIYKSTDQGGSFTLISGSAPASGSPIAAISPFGIAFIGNQYSFDFTTFNPSDLSALSWQDIAHTTGMFIAVASNVVANNIQISRLRLP